MESAQQELPRREFTESGRRMREGLQQAIDTGNVQKVKQALSMITESADADIILNSSECIDLGDRKKQLYYSTTPLALSLQRLHREMFGHTIDIKKSFDIFELLLNCPQVDPNASSIVLPQFDYVHPVVFSLRALLDPEIEAQCLPSCKKAFDMLLDKEGVDLSIRPQIGDQLEPSVFAALHELLHDHVEPRDYVPTAEAVDATLLLCNHPTTIPCHILTPDCNPARGSPQSTIRCMLAGIQSTIRYILACIGENEPYALQSACFDVIRFMVDADQRSFRALPLAVQPGKLSKDECIFLQSLLPRQELHALQSFIHIHRKKGVSLDVLRRIAQAYLLDRMVQCHFSGKSPLVLTDPDEERIRASFSVRG